MGRGNGVQGRAPQDEDEDEEEGVACGMRREVWSSGASDIGERVLPRTRSPCAKPKPEGAGADCRDAWSHAWSASKSKGAKIACPHLSSTRAASSLLQPGGADCSLHQPSTMPSKYAAGLLAAIATVLALSAQVASAEKYVYFFNSKTNEVSNV